MTTTIMIIAMFVGIIVEEHVGECMSHLPHDWSQPTRILLVRILYKVVDVILVCLFGSLAGWLTVHYNDQWSEHNSRQTIASPTLAAC